MGSPQHPASFVPDTQDQVQHPASFVPDNKQPSLVEQGIDLIPGMKARREEIAQYRTENPTPKPITGMEDPAYKAMGMVGPSSALGLVKSMGRVGKGIQGFFKPAAERAEVAAAMKTPSTFEPFLENKIGQAKEAFNKSQIAPRMAEQIARADEQMVPINVSQIKGVHPEVDKIIEEAQQAVASQPYGARSYSQSSTPTTINLPMKDAIKIRQQLNSVTPSFDNPGLKDAALKAGNHVRNALSEADPNVAQLSDEMAEAYNTQKGVFGPTGKKDAFSTIYPSSGKAGLAKTGRLQAFDKASGSPINLEQLGQNVKTAQQRTEPITLSDLVSVAKGPQKAVGMLANPVMNAYDKFGSSIYNIPTASRESQLFNLIRGITPKQENE